MPFTLDMTRLATRACLRLGTVLAVAGVAACAAPTMDDVTAALQTRFTRTDLSSGLPVAGIIALGGDPARITEALRLAQTLPNAKVVISGATDDDYAYSVSRPVLEKRILLERNARTTFENAVYSRRLLHPTKDERWILVTSASHMPRAVGSFRTAGFEVAPWPVADSITGQIYVDDRTLHEVLGLIGYWLLGRSESLFPAMQARKHDDARQATARPAGSVG